MDTAETELLTAVAMHTRRRPRTLRDAARTALVVATVANALLFVLGERAGLFPDWVLIPGVWKPVTLVRVLFDTLLGVGVGLGAFALLRLRYADPRRFFQKAALTLLVLSFTQPPLVLRTAPARMVIALCALHAVAALVLLGVLRDVEARRGRQ